MVRIYRRKTALRGRGAYRSERPSYARRYTVRRPGVMAGGGAYRRRAYRGRGAYSPGKFIDAIVSNRKYYAPIMGAVAGGMTGGIPGVVGGLGAGTAFNKAMGWGDYNVKANSLVSGAQIAPEVPAMHTVTDGMRVVHREYIQDVSSSIAFTLNSFKVNPGISGTFPWLSTIANNFQQYQVMGMIFYFRSTSADALNSTNTALGTVIMAADYDSASPNFISKNQMEQASWAVSGKPACDLMAPIECAPRETSVPVLYVRNGGLTSGSDIRLYDLCNFQFATVGSQAAAVIGELWVTYDIIFSKPIVTYGAPSSTYSAHYQFNASSSTIPFGTSRVQAFDNMQLTFSQTVMTIPAYVAGLFQITWYYTGLVAGAPVVAPALTLTNCTLQTFWVSDTSNSASHGGTTTSLIFSVIVLVPVSTAASTIAVGTAGTFPTSQATGEVWVAQLNQGITS